MKKITLFICFILFGLYYSQSYKPLLVDGNKWYMKSQYVGMGGEARYLVDDGYYYIEKDTIIHNNSYKKINYHYFYHSYNCSDMGCSHAILPIPDAFAAYLREDINQKKVYRYYKSDDSDHLLYDFSVNIGDEINLSYNDSIISPESNITPKNYTVLGKAKGKLFNNMEVNYISFGNPLNIFEGIGSSNGLLITPGCNYFYIKGMYGDINPIFYRFENSSGIIIDAGISIGCNFILGTEEVNTATNLKLDYSKKTEDFKIIDNKTQDINIKFYDFSGKFLDEINTKTNQNFKLHNTHNQRILIYIISNKTSTWKGKIMF